MCLWFTRFHYIQLRAFCVMKVLFLVQRTHYIPSSLGVSLPIFICLLILLLDVCRLYAQLSVFKGNIMFLFFSLLFSVFQFFFFCASMAAIFFSYSYHSTSSPLLQLLNYLTFTFLFFSPFLFSCFQFILSIHSIVFSIGKKKR